MEDPSAQKLTVTVMHEGEMAQSRLIGRAVLPLAGKCQPGALQDLWLPLDVDDSGGRGSRSSTSTSGGGDKDKPRGKVHLELVYRLREEDNERTILEKEMGIGGSGEGEDGEMLAIQRSTRGGKDRFQRGVLMVTVDRGLELVAKDAGQTSDPFVVLSVSLSRILFSHMLVIAS